MHLMVSLATENCGTLKQGNSKIAFCQGILSDDEITIVKPPIGDTDATKNKYWLLKHTLSLPLSHQDQRCPQPNWSAGKLVGPLFVHWSHH
jgi:hypothetical protein